MKLKLLVLFGWTLACGGAAGPATSPAPAATSAPPAARAGLGADAGDRETGSRPRALVTVRLAQPEATIKKALAAFPQYMPPPARDLRRVAVMGVGRTIAGLVAFDRPIEIRFYEHNPSPAVVLTSAVRQGVDARAELARGLQVEEKRDGRLEIRPPNAFTAELGLAKECELERRGDGDTISCSSVEGYLARTRETRSVRKIEARELTVEFEVDPFRPQFMKDMEHRATARDASEDPSAAAGRAMGEELMKGFVQDLRAVDLSGSLSDDAVTAAVTMRLQEGRSLFAHVLGASDAAAPAPARFFRLPVDSDAAFFSRGVEAKAWEPIKKVFVDSIVAEMARDTEYPDAIVTEMRQWMNNLFLTGGPWMVATGRRTSAIRDVVKKGAADRAPDEERKIVYERALKPWTIFELDEAGDGAVAKAKALLDFGRRADQSAKARPAAKGAGGASSDKPRRKSTTRIAATPAGFPAGTLHVEDRSVSVDQPKNTKLLRVTHVYVVPEGDHVWIGFGNDEKTVTDHLKNVLDGRPASSTLAARPGVDAIAKGAPVTSAGFFSLNAILGLNATDPKAEAQDLLGKINYLGAIISKGNAPFVVAVRRGGDAPQDITIETTTSVRSLDELIGYVQQFEVSK